jgi:thiol-disulfide isomerase/thioredoxin
MGNMGGDCNGQDKGYMTINCPKTCGFCEEAEKSWKAEEEERKKNPTYEPEDSAVIIVDGDSIEDFIEQEGPESLILLEFFAPWCGHCQQVSPSFRAAAKELSDLSEAGKIPIPVRLAKYDDGDAANQHYRAADPAKWNFTSYPSMFVVGGGTPFTYAGAVGEKKVHYWGGHETDEIVHHMTMLSEGKNQTEARIAYHEIEKGKKPGFYKEGGKHHTKQAQVRRRQLARVGRARRPLRRDLLPVGHLLLHGQDGGAHGGHGRLGVLLQLGQGEGQGAHRRPGQQGRRHPPQAEGGGRRRGQEGRALSRRSPCCRLRGPRWPALRPAALLS